MNHLLSDHGSPPPQTFGHIDPGEEDHGESIQSAAADSQLAEREKELLSIRQENQKVLRECMFPICKFCECMFPHS